MMVQAEQQKNASETDIKDAKKLTCPTEYVAGIVRYLRSRETVTASKPGYLKNQPELNENMRAKLIDWLIAMSDKFNLLSETLFLAANIVDRYLDHERIQKSRLPLVGVAAILIASKVEEYYPPSLHDFSRASEKIYMKEEVLKMEMSIFKQLKYDISGATVFRFIERYTKLTGATELISIGRYILRNCS